jgi:hypothetical protein
MLLATLMNVVLMTFLTAWFFWWRRAMGQLANFKEARVEMAGLVAQLQTQLEQAQTEMTKLSAVVHVAVPEMQSSIRRAEHLLTELTEVVGSGERVADRLEDVAKRARVAATPLALHEEPRAWGAPVEASELRSRAEGAALALVRGGVESSKPPARKIFRGRPSAAAARHLAAEGAGPEAPAAP